jgi:hypothetical protein
MHGKYNIKYSYKLYSYAPGKEPLVPIAQEAPAAHRAFLGALDERKIHSPCCNPEHDALVAEHAHQSLHSTL